MWGFGSVVGSKMGSILAKGVIDLTMNIHERVQNQGNKALKE